MRRRHWIADARAEAFAGMAAMAAGAVLLHDAFERRSKSQPWWLRPFSWW